jgi:hypothetical protein
MNKERMLALADAIEQENIIFNNKSLKFDMSVWAYQQVADMSWAYQQVENMPDVRWCGTYACMAGMAVCMYEPEKFKTYLFDEVEEIGDLAKEILELTGEDCEKLFYNFSLDRKSAPKFIRDYVKDH